MDSKQMCPCCSGKTYGECCQPCHQGTPATDACALMRSRYSAYALQNAGYIMATTHPAHPSYTSQREEWKRDILSFSRHTHFDKLEVLDFQDGPERAYVTFLAHLRQRDRDASFQEISLFEKVNDRWLYKEGIIVKAK